MLLRVRGVINYNMPTFVTTLPQTTTPIITVTLPDLVKILPDKLPWSINIWIGDKLSIYGITAENLVFLTDEPTPTAEQKQYFNDLVKSLGAEATLYEGWKNEEYRMLPLYCNGALNINRDMTYKVPKTVYQAPVLKLDEAITKLPKKIPFKHKLYFTGGLVKNGWTANDFDFIAPDVEDRDELRKMAKYFTDILGWKTDVGHAVMIEREPVFLYPMYKDGQCLLPSI
jgi:hypothetical protein